MKLRATDATGSTMSGAASGCYIPDRVLSLQAWLPSTWPAAPIRIDQSFVKVLRTIFREGMPDELDNVIGDAVAHNESLEHRGHVIAIATMCALDTVASFTCIDKTNGAQRRRFVNFIAKYFPAEFKPFAEELYVAYRNALVHSWFLFRVAITPGQEPITSDTSGIPSVGLLKLREALDLAVDGYLSAIQSDPSLEKATLVRYCELQSSALC